ncbi:GIY-YIG nuclease family protein [Sporosarcina sp. D27]|uniref:GIY-YIG nuclease family protein n=1 Tax=Sporosarcina sp. D27 TaxID=1382305 RepID=UPI0004BC89CF|nr:GIY-YIG nuclease family protein [Sporosarcina sp. D27]
MKGYKDEWWYSTPMIFGLTVFGILIIPFLAAIVLMIIQMQRRAEFYAHLEKSEQLFQPIKEREKKIESLAVSLKSLEEDIGKNEIILSDQETYINNLHDVVNSKAEKERDELIASIELQKEEVIKKAKEEAEKIVQEASTDVADVIKKFTEYQKNIVDLSEEHGKLSKEVERYKKQARKYKSDIIGLKNFDERFPNTVNFELVGKKIEQLEEELEEDRLLGTVIRLHLHSDNSKELRKLSNATNKEIQTVLEKYEDRYTTKGNKTIYNLMVIGLQAEIQILLLQLRFNKLDESKQAVKDIITKYLSICANGNMNILPTITRFLTEIEPLYLELIDIEYKYYMYREREKEEQRIIREQMKQEAAERKQLEEERKKLEKEEEKFSVEIIRNKKLLEEETDEEKIKQLEERLQELANQVNEIESKKEEITSLTLGKAGYVYVISNLGSFGTEMFKIGMTRRMNPQDRVDELGSASVPFKFDVHAMIFSDDAVGLEAELHKRLSSERVNKVNYRKEFFRTNVSSLRELVEEIDPTVEFVTTMLAEEYNQTQALEEAELVS